MVYLPPLSSCLTPISVKPKKGHPARDGFFYHSVPCGKCASCRLRRIQGWVFRLLQEEKNHNTSWFVTLTYDLAPVTFNGFMTLRRSDLTKFFKRLRKQTKKKTIRYYACGEYGTKTLRPHYHAIIFDATPTEIESAWTSFQNEKDYVKLGILHFGKVSGDSIAYTAKYMAKESKIPMHDHDDRVPEYSVMSKHLGASYMTPEIIKYHKEGYRSYLTMPGGATHAMPRYYRDKIFSEADKKHMNEITYDKYDKIFESEVSRFGSVEEYYRVMHEAVKMSNLKFNTSRKEKL